MIWLFTALSVVVSFVIAAVTVGWVVERQASRARVAVSDLDAAVQLTYVNPETGAEHVERGRGWRGLKKAVKDAASACHEASECTLSLAADPAKQPDRRAPGLGPGARDKCWPRSSAVYLQRNSLWRHEMCR